MNKRLIVIAASCILALATLNIRLNYFALSPGTLEETRSLISIEGTGVTESTGKLLLTTVYLRELLAIELPGAVLDDTIDLVKRTAIVPKGSTFEELDAENKRDIEVSKITAAVAALQYLGTPVDFGDAGARVTGVAEGFPAAEKLRPDDVIISVNGRRICGADDVPTAVTSQRPGASFVFGVLRGGERIDVTLASIPAPGAENYPLIGAEIAGVGSVPQLPVKVDIESRDIGGPSAGLMFSLGIADLLSPTDIARGRVIAGTGTIGCDGFVGPVGGIAQKMAAAERDGAEIMLVPSLELGDACERAKKAQVIAVSTLDDAVAALTDPEYASTHGCLAARGSLEISDPTAGSKSPETSFPLAVALFVFLAIGLGALAIGAAEGWLRGLAGAAALATVLAGIASPDFVSNAPTTIAALLGLVLGAALLSLAWRRSRTSLSRRIPVLGMATLALALAVSGGVTSRVAVASARNTELARLSSAAARAADSVAADGRVLQQEAADNIAIATNLSPGADAELAAAIADLDAEFAIVADPDARGLAVAGLDPADASPLLAAAASATDTVKLGYAQSTLGLITSATVRSPASGRILVLGTVLNSNDLARTAEESDAFVSVVDVTGQVIAGGTLAPPQLSGLQLNSRVDARSVSDGFSVAAAAIPDTPLRFIAFTGPDRVGSIGESIVRAVLAALIAAAAVGAVAALWFGDRAIRPLVALTSAVLARRRGEDSPIPAPGSDEVGELSRSISQLFTEVDQAENARAALLDAVGHELRTPLTPLRGYASLLKRGKLSRANSAAAAEGISDAVDRLERVTSDLIDFAAARSLLIDRTRMDARSVLAGVREKHPDLEFRGPTEAVEIDGDWQMLVRAVTALVDNAITHGDGDVRVTVTRTPDGCRFGVHDQGSGIAPEKVDMMLKAFRAEGPNRASGGIGLGLTIADAVAKAHGGGLKFASTGGGFVVALSVRSEL